MLTDFVKSTDQELLTGLRSLASKQALVECAILQHLLEVSDRRLHLKEGYSSIFYFIKDYLKCSEATASRRVAIITVGRRFPLLLQYIAQQKISLTGASLLAPHLTEDNLSFLLDKATGRSTRSIELLVSNGRGNRRRDVIRRLLDLEEEPVVSPIHGEEALVESSCDQSSLANEADVNMQGKSSTEGDNGSLSSSEAVDHKVFSPESETAPHRARVRARITFDASEVLLKKIERLREVLGNRLKHDSLDEIFTLACDSLLDKTDPERKVERREKREAAAVSKPGVRLSATKEKIERRYIPQHIKVMVWRRDQGRCTYTSADGKRCGTRKRLQYDHIRPWALGGSNDVENIRLLCRAHNLYMAERYFGRRTSLKKATDSDQERIRTRNEDLKHQGLKGKNGRHAS